MYMHCQEVVKAPVLKGTSVDRVYVVFGARVDFGCFTIRLKNGFVVGCVR